MMALGELCVRVIVRGRVQGVSYRASMKHVAEANSVRGWVRNNPDGSVEALLQGRGEDVRKVLEWSRRGPWGARVNSLDTENTELDASIKAFSIVR